MTNENISPANIGGMGPISLPSGDTVGSGDVPAGRGDAKKKKKKKNKMLFSTFNEFVNEEYEATGKYNTVKKVIKELGRRPSEKDVAEFIMKNYKDVTGKELRNSDPDSEDKIADIVGFYKFDIDEWEEAMYYAQNESVSEGTFQGNQIAIYNGEDGETYIEKKGKGYYGYNNEFDFTAKNKKELEQMLSGWGYYKIAGSIDEAKDDRSHIILRVASRNVNNMAFKLQDMHVNHRVEDPKKGIIKVYTDPTSGWHGNEKAQYKLTHDVWVDKFVVKESVDEANTKDAREDLGYVAFLEEMAEINPKDLQNAYDAAIEVLQDKNMSEKQAIGFLNSPHGKYMGEYLVPGMDYSHEAFLDKLDEYYNERMLKKYAKEYVSLAESMDEGFFSRLKGKETTKEEREIDNMVDKIQKTDVGGLFDDAMKNLDTLDKVMAALDEADPDDVDDAFKKYRKKTAKYKNFMKVLKGTNRDLEKQFGKEALDDFGLKSKNMMDQFTKAANDIAKK
jgi:hypothetical protein